jgi:hypothetical protein
VSQDKGSYDALTFGDRESAEIEHKPPVAFGPPAAFLRWGYFPDAFASLSSSFSAATLGSSLPILARADP